LGVVTTDNNNIIITNNTDINTNNTDHSTNPLIHNNNNHIALSNTDETQNTTGTEPLSQTHLHNDAPTTTQYLISQFFTSTRTTTPQVNPEIEHQHTNRINNTNIIPINNITIDDTLPLPIHETNTNSIISCTQHHATNTQTQRRRKNYVQQHPIRRPVPNDYWDHPWTLTIPNAFEFIFKI
jgi:hypothetical protein